MAEKQVFLTLQSRDSDEGDGLPRGAFEAKTGKESCESEFAVARCEVWGS